MEVWTKMINTMHKAIIPVLALLALAGCQKTETLAEKPADKKQTIWSVTIEATKENPRQPETKGLDFVGDAATTTQLSSVWKDDEPVKVYLGTELIGTLTATPIAGDPHKATLSGTVVTSSLEERVSTITLLTPRSDWNYTGQTGILLAEDNSIEKMYHYTAAANVLVTSVDSASGTIGTASAIFTNQQSIYRMSFRYKEDESTKTPITAKSVTIASAGGHLVQSQAVDGSSVAEGAISVTLGTAGTAPFFVALRNGDETNTEDLLFTVVNTDGVTYLGTKTIPAEYKPNGTFVSIKNTTLDKRLGVSLSNTEIAEVW